MTVPAPDWPVMAITKCPIWASPVDRFTVASRAFTQCARTPAMTLAEDGEDDEQEHRSQHR